MTVRMLDDVRPEESDHDFLPGMRRAWMMPWYDLVARTRGLGRLYRRTVELAGISPGRHVLDVGCGTGNLSREVLRAVPDAVVTGLDPDGDALRRAARKLGRRPRAQVTLVRGFAHRLPVEDASQDHVISSLTLHHVPRAEKERLAAEVARVLRPGGRVTIADFAGDHASEHGHGNGHRHGAHDGATHDADNADGGIEKLLTAAGLTDARALERMTVLGDSVVFVQTTRQG